MSVFVAECGECQFSMGNDTAALRDTFHTYWDEVQMIGEVQTLDSQLQVNAVNKEVGRC